jgi:ribonuclease-3
MKFIKQTIIAEFEKKQNGIKKLKQNSDSKNEYQEYVQKRKLGSVGYETLSKIGPDHLPEFRVAALLNGCRVAEGKGLSKKAAEAAAAAEALKRIKKQGGRVK